MTKIFSLLVTLCLISISHLKLQTTEKNEEGVVPDYYNPNDLITILKTYTQFKFRSQNGIFFHYNLKEISEDKRTSTCTALNNIYTRYNHNGIILLVDLNHLTKYDPKALENNGEKWRKEALDSIIREFGYKSDKTFLFYITQTNGATSSKMTIFTGSTTEQYITEKKKASLISNYLGLIKMGKYDNILNMILNVDQTFKDGKASQKEKDENGLNAGFYILISLGVLIVVILLALLLCYFVGPKTPCHCLTWCCDSCVDSCSKKGDL